MHFRKLFAFICLFGFSFLAVAQDQEQTFDYGQLQNGIYSNNYFGFSVKIPESWSVVPDKQKNKNRKDNFALFSGENVALQALLKDADTILTNLLTICEFPEGSLVLSNPSFNIVAERFNPPAGFTSKDYLSSSVRLMAMSPQKYKIKKNIYYTQVGGKEFAVLENILILPGVKERQQHYVMLKDNYGLTLSFRYVNKEDKKKLDEILSSLVFN